MKYNLRRNLLASTAKASLLIVAGVAGSLIAGTAYAQAPAAAAQRLNPTGRQVSLTVPAMESGIYIGDIVVTIDPNDNLTFSSDRVIDLLSPRLIQTAADRLRSAFNAKPGISPADFAGTGISASYDPQTLQLTFIIPVELRTTQNVSVANLNPALVGTFQQPAKFSAFINARGSVQHIEKGTNPGFQSPVIFLNGATRMGNMAFESEAIWHPGVSNVSALQRQGSRGIYDDTDHLVRWTFGDLQPIGQGFQSVPFISGLSLFRSYGVLNPGLSVRPTGDQTFQLTRPSDVTITVNGTNVQRLHLNAGSYNLRDFPFSQGANDVTVSIRDDAGREETINFNVFYDQTQLAKGLTEFGVYAGVKSPLASYGRDYTDQWVITGFLRRGLTDRWTLGGNFQIDQNSVMGGYQSLWSSPIGTFGLNVAGSSIEGIGTGYAATATFQRLFQATGGGRGDALNLAVTTRSRNFGPVGTTTPDNRYDYELSGGYTHAFNDSLYGSLTGHYSMARTGFTDIHDYHAILGYRLSTDLGLTVDTSYQQGGANHGFGTFVSLTWRVSGSTSVRGDYNSRFNDARLSLQSINGSGVGSYNLSADVQKSDLNSGFNATANYIANRAQLGLSHFTSSDAGFSTINSESTSFNFGTSLAFADGSFAIGRPVNQSFAIVQPHPSLNGATVEVNPNPDYYLASSGALGNALDPELSSYVPQTITVDAPGAPPGYDLGNGAFRVNPPYRSGYKLVVGSDYNMTVVGRLLNADGSPVSLIAGRAIEVANPNREAVVLFTNAQGRFGLSGLRPGRWRIEMPTEPASVFILDVPEGNTSVAAGDLKPSAGN